MITYNNKQINGLFSKLDKAVTTAAKSAFTQAALNEKPALLSFDNSETNLMTYTAIRNNNVYATQDNRMEKFTYLSISFNLFSSHIQFIMCILDFYHCLFS